MEPPKEPKSCLNTCVADHKGAIALWSAMWVVIAVLSTVLVEQYSAHDLFQSIEKATNEINSSVDAVLSDVASSDSTSESRTRRRTRDVDSRRTVSVVDTVRIAVFVPDTARVYATAVPSSPAYIEVSEAAPECRLVRGRCGNRFDNVQSIWRESGN